MCQSEESFSLEISIVSVIFQMKWKYSFAASCESYSKIAIRWCPAHNAEQISQGTRQCLFYLHQWTDIMTNSFCRHSTGGSGLALRVSTWVQSSAHLWYFKNMWMLPHCQSSPGCCEPCLELAWEWLPSHTHGMSSLVLWGLRLKGVWAALGTPWEKSREGKWQ